MLRIKELRVELGLNQKDIAEKLGITQQAYANYERGARQPDNNTLIKLAKLFDVSIDYLLGISDFPKQMSLDEQLSGIDFALWGEVQDMTDAEKQDIIDYIQFRKTKRTD